MHDRTCCSSSRYPGRTATCSGFGLGPTTVPRRSSLRMRRWWFSGRCSTTSLPRSMRRHRWRRPSSGRSHGRSSKIAEQPPPVPYVVELLSAAHDLSAFDSGNERLDAWLRTSARHSDGRNLTRTYVWHRRDEIVRGYYTLAPYFIERATLSRAAWPMACPSASRVTSSLDWRSIAPLTAKASGRSCWQARSSGRRREPRRSAVATWWRMRSTNPPQASTATTAFSTCPVLKDDWRFL